MSVISTMDADQIHELFLFDPNNFDSRISVGERYDLCGEKVGQLIELYELAIKESLIGLEQGSQRVNVEAKDDVSEDESSSSDDEGFVEGLARQASRALAARCVVKVGELQGYQNQLLAAIANRAIPLLNQYPRADLN